ncbi:hypothetical protein D0C36_20755 [Mucilaginibacter conchicola]|uniref:Uncharacterized protein n=1 Tax=Mucilaginibacter conchicola TaxID=2303333 RepID=A0A372NMQ6_9SPHI|nr:hypothetical protein D0C36_20755 [Mucilaginibacter conchicola]
MLPFIAGCEGGTPSLPTRKKMPELNNYNDAFEGGYTFGHSDSKADKNHYGFTTSNVDLNYGSVSRPFVQFDLPDSSTDSATVSLLQNLKPFALPLLANFARRQRNGVAIDLTLSPSKEKQRTDFLLEQQDGFSIPVVIFYDKSTAYRMNEIKALAAQMPTLRLNPVTIN